MAKKPAPPEPAPAPEGEEKIRAALVVAGGNRHAAAEKLNLPFGTLARWLRPGGRFAKLGEEFPARPGRPLRPV